ncbi:unnamed protein product [Bursaphelenchus okinawaensis]|uniref:Uncharacterized protein n=1 Tax=Bursaphelenchus okinawaensis TaxID=465554 RepID=A0A811KEQ9_9BILA|nr:unnamed protein product [Bursaphelenchus okinawaensis]CAG9102358.1 unnamed protein product [Bursaphelenchus okinawaensis]
MGKYMSVDPENVVLIHKLSCNAQSRRNEDGYFRAGSDLPLIKFSDIPPDEISSDIKDLQKECWQNDDLYCVNNMDTNKIIAVPRANPILSTKNATIYGFCCDYTNVEECGGGRNDRCVYFVYDQNTGVDYYLDDQMKWTTDEFKDPSYLIPAPVDDDRFFSHVRPNHTTPTTPAPKVPTQAPPSGPCCGLREFLMYFSFGKGGPFQNATFIKH